MWKENRKSIIFGALLIIGLVILVKSINLGRDEAFSILQSNGGSMDTNTYLIYIEQCIIKYRYLGAILSILGGIGVILNITDK